MAEDEASRFAPAPDEGFAPVETSPDRLATLGTLFGMAPPAVGSARVLELGCAAGGNLLPMAVALPDARFVGLDASPDRIATARGRAEALGLGNVAFRVGGPSEFDESLGAFDYIVCHGVYSWVPEEVRDRILPLVAGHLAPQGVAYVSYNTYPGWHGRGIVRDLLTFHVERIGDPAEQVRAARELLGALGQPAPGRSGALTRILAEEVGRLADQGDAYLSEEFLGPENEPLYYRDFVALAAEHGLQPVADARPATMVEFQPPELLTGLDRLAPPADLLRREQFLDFLRMRSFRRTLLTHAAVPLTRPPSPEAVARLRLTTRVRAVSPRPDLHGPTVEEFRSPDGMLRLATGDPSFKTSLAVLQEHWPRSIPFAGLLAAVQSRLGRPPLGQAAPPEAHPQALAAALLRAFGTHLVELHAFEPRFAATPSDRPVASPWARRQAESSGRVTSLLHRAIALTDFDRSVLRRLDGSRDRPALVESLSDALLRGEFSVHQEGRPASDPAGLRPFLDRSVEASLLRMAASALLVA